MEKFVRYFKLSLQLIFSVVLYPILVLGFISFSIMALMALAFDWISDDKSGYIASIEMIKAAVGCLITPLIIISAIISEMRLKEED